MNRYATEAEIPADTQAFHTLKHSIRTYLLNVEEELLFVKDWVGHKKIENTLSYARLTTATRDSRARKVFSSNLGA